MAKKALRFKRLKRQKAPGAQGMHKAQGSESTFGASQPQREHNMPGAHNSPSSQPTQQLPRLVQGEHQKKGGSLLQRWKALPTKRKVVLVVLLVLVVATIAAAVIMLTLPKQQTSSQESVESALVEQGSVTTTVVGTGTLAHGSSAEVEVPAGVKIKDVLVTSGDTVEEGEALATVEASSVAQVLLEVNEELDSVEEALSSVSGSTASVSSSSYLEYVVYTQQKKDLKAAKTLLTTLFSDPTIYATQAGTIDEVNAAEGATIGASVSSSAANANTSVTTTSGTTTTASMTTSSSDASASSSASEASTSTGSSTSTTSDAASSTSSADEQSSSASASTSQDYADAVTAAFTIASDSEMEVTISIDEADILSIEEGQSASVTLDAVDDAEFSGTITDVSTQASSSGSGSAKYTATITLEKTEDMLAGMSASATITVNESENTLVIPSAALQERGNELFVYTALDSEGNLTGQTTVETGLSNGTQVEVLSGLAEGDTVYYLVTSDSSDDEEGMRGMAGMGEMGEMGELGDRGSGRPDNADNADGGAPSAPSN